MNRRELAKAQLTCCRLVVEVPAALPNAGSPAESRDVFTDDSAAACSSARRLSVAAFSFFLNYPHRRKFVCRDLIKGNGHAGLECVFQLDRPLEQEARLRIRCSIQPVEWAVVTPAAVIRRIRTRIAQFFPPQGPVNQEPEGGLLRPLPVQKFAGRSSWNPASSASMAAFTATAWWMMGTSPA